MATVISKISAPVCGAALGILPDKIIDLLPIRMLCELKNIRASVYGAERIDEIRLRSGRRAYLTVSGQGAKRNVAMNTVLSAQELSEVLNRMCDGSLYAYSERIIKG